MVKFVKSPRQFPYTAKGLAKGEEQLFSGRSLPEETLG
jgi:hypothetical protein